MSKTLFEMTTKEAKRLFESTRWAALPVGSTEQHGPHLPLGTDAMGAIAVARQLGDLIPIVIAPPITVGYSPYHMSWSGAVTVRSETLIAMYKDVAASLARHGAEMIVFINGHGGNRAMVDVAASDVQFENAGVRTFVINWPYLGKEVMGDRMDLAHAGHLETAAVYAYDRTLVAIEEATDPSDQATHARQARYRGLPAYPLRYDFGEIQPTGWSGRPWDATPEEGEELVLAGAQRIVEILEGEFGAEGWKRP